MALETMTDTVSLRNRYCSAVCEKKDWGREHKYLCHVLQVVNQKTMAPGVMTWDQYKKVQVSANSLHHEDRFNKQELV